VVVSTRLLYAISLIGTLVSCLLHYLIAIIGISRKTNPSICSTSLLKILVQLEGNPDVLSKHLKRERRKFEQNGWVQQYSTPYLVPDRIGGLEELEELQKVCPGRIWNFVGCNVPVSDQLSD